MDSVEIVVTLRGQDEMDQLFRYCDNATDISDPVTGQIIKTEEQYADHLMTPRTVDMRRATVFDTRPVIRQRNIDLQNDMVKDNDKSTPFNGQSDSFVRLLNRFKYYYYLSTCTSACSTNMQ
ncbi:hypothetical protein T4E_3135 [Trichinella pseudospiralis]|uniref:Uncharacterized protein n=1 Tax=Trichinella pseudospiralis TaxID=6337 RepID=A0A0V0Y286_TRIPS|nr:hypothetical protein T4E_3135 [Trichinella pseudospiralis]